MSVVLALLAISGCGVKRSELGEIITDPADLPGQVDKNLKKVPAVRAPKTDSELPDVPPAEAPPAAASPATDVPAK